jgi:hypothetical protein
MVFSRPPFLVTALAVSTGKEEKERWKRKGGKRKGDSHQIEAI